MLATVVAALLLPLKFEERVIVGKASDFMIVRYLRLEGTNKQIGAKLADIARTRHSVKDAPSRSSAVSSQLTWLMKEWPEMYARTQGVASQFPNDPTSLDYNLDVAPGCSVIYYPGSSVTNGHAMLSRNYDFSTRSFAEIVGAKKPAGARAMTADPYVIEIHPDRGYASLYLASYDLLNGCIDGVNEKGLSVALLADDNSERVNPEARAGLSEISLPRYVLDRCATKEARAALASIPYSYFFTPCHYMIGDASGDSFVWEILPDLSRRFVVNGNGKPQVVTNHLLSASGVEPGNSNDRFQRLQSELAARKSRVKPEETRTINTCVQVPTSARDAATLWHSVYDLKARSMSVNFFLGKGRRSAVYDFKLNER